MKFSVIIPTRNRPAALANCLCSFTDLDFPAGEWELIVINDGGEQSFTAVTDQLQANLPLQLVTIQAAGPAAARNAGAHLARGDYLAFTDDDCCVTPDWLQQFADGFVQMGLDALGGQTLNPQADRPGMSASQFLIDFLYEYMQDQAGNALLVVSNNAAFRHEVFMTLGGFDETFPLAAAEDMELSQRLVRLGYRQAYYPAAKVWHYHQLTAWGHIRQQFRYGRGAYFFHQTGFQAIQPANKRPFYRALAEALYRAGLPFQTCLLLLVGQIAYRSGSIYQIFSSGRFSA